MKKLLLFLLAGAIVIGIAGGRSPSTSTQAAQPGLASVYQRIAAETDCAALQSQFDQATANHKSDIARHNLPLAKVSTSYMFAADDRMRAIGCY